MNAIPEAKEIYKKALKYVTRIQLELRNKDIFTVGELFEIAALMTQSIRQSEQLSSYAIYYFDVQDIARSHVVNVAIFSIALSMGMGYSDNELTKIGAAGLLHDVGIGKIPDDLFHRKIESLTLTEQKIVEAHSEFGYRTILESDHNLEDLAICTLQHHERVDGTGYPNRLHDKQIDPCAKILAIIDTYEALIHPRDYRDKLVPPLGLKEIITQKGTSFSPELVRHLIEHISIYPVGCFVLLNSGETAKVIETNRENPVRPVVRILYDSKGYHAKRQIVDLTANPLFSINACVPPPGIKPVR